jgi:Na+/phosphate symporter
MLNHVWFSGPLFPSEPLVFRRKLQNSARRDAKRMKQIQTKNQQSQERQQTKQKNNNKYRATQQSDNFLDVISSREAVSSN